LLALGVLGVGTGGAAPAPQGAGSVTVEWLGWSHYRFTAPNGKVVLTNPFTSNPDSPVKTEDITRADLIVVADGHGDEVGQTVQIANQTGALVLAPGGVNPWLVEQGVPRAQVPRNFFQPGDRFRGVDGVIARSVESVHGSELNPPTAAVPYGGVAAGYFLTFENGWTAYFSGSAPAMAEQALWAQMYKPDLVILHMGADHEPIDFAQQVKLLKTENPNLKTVYPHHNRVTQMPGQTTLAEVQAAVDAMGLGVQVTQPPLGQVVSFP
jgi:L-ascorbate metabolism protein UlaG (beta-lactamase superfamily)